MECKFSERWKYISCHDWVEDDTYMWFSLADKNAICEIDKRTKEIRVVGCFEGEPLYKRHLSYSVKKFNDYIIFAPFSTNIVSLYDKSRREITNVAIPHPRIREDYRKDAKFYRMLVVDNKILLLSLFYPGIVCLDIKSKSVDIIDSWVMEVDKRAIRYAGYLTDGCVFFEGDYYLPIGNSNGILKINSKLLTCEYLDLKVSFRGILGIVQYGNTAFVTNHDQEASEFCEWNMRNNTTKYIKMPFCDAYYAPVLCDGYLLFFGNYKRYCFQYNIETGEIEDISNILRRFEKIISAKSNGKCVKFFSSVGNGYYEYEPRKKNIEETVLRMRDDKYLVDSWNAYCIHIKENMKKSPITEGDLTLRDFIGLIVE